MLHLTKHDAKKAITRYEGLKNRIAGMREDAARITKHVVRTAEIGGTAFLLGLAQGRTDGIEVVGVPLELLLGGAGTLFSLIEGGQGYAHHIAAVADGALAAYLTTLGRGVGVTLRQKALAASGGAQQAGAQGQVGTGTAGAMGAGGGASAVTKGVTLTADEIAELARGGA